MLNLSYLRSSTEDFGRSGVGSSKVILKKTKRDGAGLLFVFESQGQSESYETLIKYPSIKEGKSYKTEVRNGKEIIKIKKFTSQDPVQVRCSCQDYRFTWAFANSLEGSFTGPKFPPYKPTGARPPRNPENMPGLCKHLIGAFRVLQNKGYLR